MIAAAVPLRGHRSDLRQHPTVTNYSCRIRTALTFLTNR
jgi:hypothetical protein